MNKIELKEQLQSAVGIVTFTKADGTERVMRCTLQSEALPQRTTESESARPENPNVLSVWDLENSGWRSFKVDAVKSFTLA